MQEPLRIYIGYDSREPIAFHVLSHSILTRASIPVAIIPLRQEMLRKAGLYTRERNALESTEFSFTRFLVPYLSGYQGYSVFMDCDMLCRVDIAELLLPIMAYFGEYVQKEGRYVRKKGLLCCQHDYTPSETTKFLGQIQTSYPRKNWSSFMVFANEMCNNLTPEVVNNETGLYLHRFKWIADELIAPLDLEWNWLIGEYQPNPRAKFLHWTLGGPWFEEYRTADHADEWFEERDAMFGAGVAY